MVTKDDKTLINNLGWQHLDDQKQTDRIGLFYETLRIRAGLVLEHRLTDKQLEEFAEVSTKGDDAATVWLKQAIPDYEDAIENERQVLVHDVKHSSTGLKKIIDEGLSQ